MYGKQRNLRLSIAENFLVSTPQQLIEMNSSPSNTNQEDDAAWQINITYMILNDTQEYETLYDVPISMIVLLSVMYGAISVLAVAGNCLVMWVVATSKKMQSVTNYYIANLALADVIIGLFAVPFQFQAALLQRWLLPHFMCAFCPFVQALSVNVSVFTLTAIAVDRHRAIITPLSAHTSKRIAKVVIVLIWLLALSLATPMAMSWEVVMEDDLDPVTNVFYKKPFCAQSEFGSHSLTIYRLVLYIFQYVIPLCVICFAYAHMAIRLWGDRAPGNAQETRDANRMKNKKKVIKMLVLVVTLFALCWLPLQSYMLLQSFFPSINEYKYINVLFFCFDWVAMSNSCYNPFIYAIYNEKFKKEFKQRFTLTKQTQRFTDSFEQGHSNRTRSLQSTVDRSVYSTHKSIKLRPLELPKSTSDSCDYIRNQSMNRDSEEHAEGNPLSVDTVKRISSLKGSKNSSPSGSERVSEIFIFANSNKLEFTDVTED